MTLWLTKSLSCNNWLINHTSTKYSCTGTMINCEAIHTSTTSKGDMSLLKTSPQDMWLQRTGTEYTTIWFRHLVAATSNLMENWFYSVSPLYGISLRNFAHATTAQLSCHVQNSMVITSLLHWWEQNFHRIWILMKKNRPWNGPQIYYTTWHCRPQNCKTNMCTSMHTHQIYRMQSDLYMSQVTNVWLFSYLVLLSFDSKTR